MKFTSFFFDLDETLYSANCGLMKQINQRLNEYCMKTTAVASADVSKFRDDLLVKYGGTLPGLTLEYGADLCDGMYYCHDIKIEDYVNPDPLLDAALARIPVQKFILTNSYRIYTTRVLRALGILERFDGIIDIVDLFPNGKPSPLAYARALEITNCKNVSECVFFDDKASNVDAAHQAGFFAVQVGSFAPARFADAHIDFTRDLLSIPQFKDMLA